MKIGVIGAGNIGTALAKRLGAAGHQVMLSYAKDLEKLKVSAEAYGALWGSPSEAAEFGDIVALAVPWNAVPDAIAAAGPMAGKTVWDCTNVLKPDLSGLEIGTSTSGAETIAALIPLATVVKAIPPFAELMHSDNPLINGEAPGVFICSDDDAAKARVADLVAALPATVVDSGPLENARYVEPAGFLLVRLAYGLGMGSRIGLSLSTD